MTPERMIAVVSLWARLYTRRLPEDDARRRVEELRADLHDHVDHERATGAGERRIAASVTGRMVRGIPADLSWRHDRTHRRTTPEDHMLPISLARRSALRVAVVTGLVLLIPAVLMLVGDGGTDWGVFDFVFAGAIIAVGGLLIELVVHSRGTAAYVAAGIAGALGVAAMIVGEADDAPGLVGFGLLLLMGTVALTVRNLQRSQERS
jgi:hypothetical protein